MQLFGNFIDLHLHAHLRLSEVLDFLQDGHEIKLKRGIDKLKCATHKALGIAKRKTLYAPCAIQPKANNRKEPSALSFCNVYLHILSTIGHVRTVFVAKILEGFHSIR